MGRCDPTTGADPPLGVHRDLKIGTTKEVSIATLTFGDLTIEGASCAGEETWFRVRPPGLAFDAGRGAVQMSGVSDLFVSHGHLDHALGIPYLLSLRQLQDSASTTIYAPAQTVDLLNDFIRAVENLEANRYRYELIPLTPGDQVSVGRDLSVEAFATDHLVPSLGYHLWRTKSRLSEAFHGRSSQELKELKSKGVPIEEEHKEIWLSYCGDTGSRIFDMEPRLFGATVLLLECTFFDDRFRDNAGRYKHMHLDDLVKRAPDFHNRDLVLHHFSRRYGCNEVREWVDRRLSLDPTRVHLFGC